MSFILEALKKSEQKRQEQNAPHPKVRKRTLSLHASRSGRRLSPWLFAGLLPLVLLVGWWFYNQADTALLPVSVAEQVAATPTPPSPPALSEPLAATPAAPEVTTAIPAMAGELPLSAAKGSSQEAEPSQAVMAAEPAPIPRPLGVSSTPARPLVTGNNAASEIKKETRDAPFATVVIEQPEPQNLEAKVIEPPLSRLPLYEDLSRELRDRVPPVKMSMHYYNKGPERRLVRINDRLLHEGDWVDRDLQLVEITETGAILDFIGKSFELRRARR